MNNLTFVIFSTLLISSVYSQTCQPHPKGVSTDQLAAFSSIVVEVSPHPSDELNHLKKGALVNVTAAVVGVFPNRNGGLVEGSEITFGPVGKAKNCTNLKVDGSAYLLFLQEPDQNGFYWIQYNPVKAVKRTIRKVQKVLCNNCLVPASFKKTTKTIKKGVGKKLKIRCKAKGKPRASLTWYHNGVLLTGTTKEIKIKNNKKGRSGSLEISSLAKHHDGNIIICSATNIASNQAANYTLTLKVAKNDKAKCAEKCTEKHANFCYHGKCCLQHNTPHCLCSSKWSGPRCERRAAPSFRTNFSEDYRHQQRLVAILGMCLALMVILFLCFSVYCLFKKRRGKLHHKMLIEGYGLTDASPMLQRQEESEDNIINGRVFPTAAVNHIDLDGARDSRCSNLNSFSGHSKQLSDNQSDVSSLPAVLGESSSRSHPKLMKKASITTITSESGINGKRNRLNGLAKSGSTRSSIRRNENSMQNNSNSTALRSKDPTDISSLVKDEAGSKSSLSHHETHVVPSIPLDNGIRSMVKNQSANPSMSSSHEGKRSESPIEQNHKPVQHLRLHIPQPTPHGTTTDNKHHTVTTFSPDGDVQQQSLGRNEGTLSSVTPHSPVSSSENIRNPIIVSSAAGNLSQSNPSASEEPGQEKSWNKNSNNNRVIGIGQDMETRTSDHDDPFKGMEIPDTSLGLYGTTPQQSLKKPKLTRQMHAVNTDGFYYPNSVSRPYASPSVVPAQLPHLPRSQQTSSLRNTDTSDPDESLSSATDNESSFDESESPRILV